MAKKRYWVDHIKVTNPERHKDYIAANAVPLKKYGVRFLVRNGACEVHGGSLQGRRHVVIEFESYAIAKACHDSPEYQAPGQDSRRGQRCRFRYHRGPRGLTAFAAGSGNSRLRAYPPRRPPSAGCSRRRRRRLSRSIAGWTSPMLSYPPCPKDLIVQSSSILGQWRQYASP
jgi:uncharacterized protein (DUF1330 family)